MILVLKTHITFEQATSLRKKLEWMNLKCTLTQEHDRYLIAILGGTDSLIDFQQFLNLPYVENVFPFTQKFKLASRDFKKDKTIITIKEQQIGGGVLSVMAGPCSIESEEQIFQTAAAVAKAGATILRGGGFKPRTSPYDFQGLGEEGLKYMHMAAKENGLLCVSEVMDLRDAETLANYVDILQIGARNMQNFSLLKQIGQFNKPILLKRGLSATYSEFLMAAEYILQSGNPHVLLCERGIRTFETYTRNTLDLAAVPVLKELSHLPVIIDPSHGTGIRKLVPPMACAAVAAGCDGLIIEVHPHPERSISDANQTLSIEMFQNLMDRLRKIGPAVDMEVL